MTRLTKILGNPELGWLVERLVKRVERGLSLDSGNVTLKEPTAAQRSSVDDLLGRRSTSGGSLAVAVERVGSGEAIVVALRELGYVIRNLRAEKEALAEQWDAVFALGADQFSGNSVVVSCLGQFSGSGLLKRLSGGDLEFAENLIGQFGAVIEGIPHDDVLLASLAAKVTGDSHALDRGRPLGAMCLHAIREIEGVDGARSAEKRRSAWGLIGVTVDDLSSPVLCLNLRALPGSDLAPWIDWHVARGEPFFLTFRQLRKFVPDPTMDAVFVCENPAVVSEAAQRLGASSAALVCMNGLPNSGVKRLLRTVSECLVPIRVRADFDWAGLRFVHQLLQLETAQVWRMGAEDYRTCAAGQALKGDAFAPEWACDLAAAMEERGTAAYEEAMVGLLLEDLEGVAPASGRCDG